MDRLPFDQNCLAAMVAPRPLLYGCAVEDTWANPPGQFEMLQSADVGIPAVESGRIGSQEDAGSQPSQRRPTRIFHSAG